MAADEVAPCVLIICFTFLLWKSEEVQFIQHFYRFKEVIAINKDETLETIFQCAVYEKERDFHSPIFCATTGFGQWCPKNASTIYCIYHVNG